MNASYVLITAAHNEQAYIERTLLAVIGQTVRPERWVIVDDGSDDRTREITRNYSAQYDWISIVSTGRDGVATFGCQARAQNIGYEQVEHFPYDYVGYLDADVSFDTDYFERLLRRFEADPRLGIGGGWLLEWERGDFRGRPMNRERCVPGAVQMFRRSARDVVGPFIELEYGGHDTIAEAIARMRGWRTRSFPDLKVIHHRRSGTAMGGTLRTQFYLGLREEAVGSSFWFAAFKSLYRIGDRPPVVASAFRLFGYCWGVVRRTTRLVPREVQKFRRREEREVLKHSLYMYGLGKVTGRR
jgi:glycosyltransferase involved in cell wall biosynthesis